MRQDGGRTRYRCILRKVKRTRLQEMLRDAASTDDERLLPHRNDCPMTAPMLADRIET